MRETLLQGVVGSTAYGLATPESDKDILGVCALPTMSLCLLNKPQESWVTTEPDCTHHEAGKYCHLAIGGNPTVLELMWLPTYEVITPLGEELISIRSSFLSAKRVRDAYFGYATQQFHRIRSRGDNSFSSDTRKRTEKHARHLYRLLIQGYSAWRHGEVPIKLNTTQRDKIFAFGARVAEGNLGLMKEVLHQYENAFDLTPTVLPQQPDKLAVTAWLMKVRKEFW